MFLGTVEPSVSKGEDSSLKPSASCFLKRSVAGSNFLNMETAERRGREVERFNQTGFEVCGTWVFLGIAQNQNTCFFGPFCLGMCGLPIIRSVRDDFIISRNHCHMYQVTMKYIYIYILYIIYIL